MYLNSVIVESLDGHEIEDQTHAIQKKVSVDCWSSNNIISNSQVFYPHPAGEHVYGFLKVVVEKRMKKAKPVWMVSRDSGIRKMMEVRRQGMSVNNS